MGLHRIFRNIEPCGYLFRRVTFGNSHQYLLLTLGEDVIMRQKSILRLFELGTEELSPTKDCLDSLQQLIEICRLITPSTFFSVIILTTHISSCIVLIMILAFVSKRRISSMSQDTSTSISSTSTTYTWKGWEGILSSIGCTLLKASTCVIPLRWI